jgi:hypothetical protein
MPASRDSRSTASTIEFTTGTVLYDALNLNLALGPDPVHELALLIQIALELFEFLDDALNTLTEARPNQVLIDLLDLRLLTGLRAAQRRQLNERVPERDGDRNGATRMCDPSAVDQAKCLYFLRKRLGMRATSAFTLLWSSRKFVSHPSFQCLVDLSSWLNTKAILAVAWFTRKLRKLSSSTPTSGIRSRTRFR